MIKCNKFWLPGMNVFICKTTPHTQDRNVAITQKHFLVVIPKVVILPSCESLPPSPPFLGKITGPLPVTVEEFAFSGILHKRNHTACTFFPGFSLAYLFSDSPALLPVLIVYPPPLLFLVSSILLYGYAITCLAPACCWTLAHFQVLIIIDKAAVSICV